MIEQVHSQPQSQPQPHNGEMEEPLFKITLIDREIAGWYPEYREFCNAKIVCRFKPDWLELVPDILD